MISINIYHGYYCNFCQLVGLTLCPLFCCKNSIKWFQPRQYIPPPAKEWCQCGKCHPWPEKAMNVCCRNHDIWCTADYGQEEPVIGCIAESQNIQDLLRPAPLRMMYNNYKTYHGMSCHSCQQHHWWIMCDVR